MSNIEAGQKIKALRLQAGMSQEEIARQTQLSLRTIQRIENNETFPRGDSLKKIAAALGVTVEVFTTMAPAVLPLPAVKENICKEDKMVLVLMNLSALAYLEFALLGIFVPMVLWAVFKDKISGADKMGKIIMKDQLWYCLLVGGSYAFLFSGAIFHTSMLANASVVMILTIAFYFLNSLVILFNILICLGLKAAIKKLAACCKLLFIKTFIRTKSFS